MCLCNDVTNYFPFGCIIYMYNSFLYILIFKLFYKQARNKTSHTSAKVIEVIDVTNKNVSTV